VCGDTLEHSKPHPAPLLYACAQLAVDPKSCLFVGDDKNDMIAGKNAICVCDRCAALKVFSCSLCFISNSVFLFLSLKSQKSIGEKLIKKPNNSRYAKAHQCTYL
jgi:3-deoxy-D-manno-octulosonate 8-phosphate phosphatase KdsC-like HAD superfamily phosphatase